MAGHLLRPLYLSPDADKVQDTARLFIRMFPVSKPLADSRL